MTDQEIEASIKRNLRIAVSLLIFAFVVPVISVLLDFCATRSDPFYWFQRSGSITVLFAVIAEYFLFRVDGDINPPPSSYVAEMKWNDRYGDKHRFCSVLALMLAVLGTFIWGYGDILFRAS